MPTGFERAVARVRPAAERAGRDPVRGADRGRAGGVRGRRGRRRGRRGGARRAARRDERAPRPGRRAHQRRPRPHRRSSARRGRRSPPRSSRSSSQGAAVVLCEPEWQALARSSGAETIVLTGRSNLALAVAAAETFLGRPGRSAPRRRRLSLPGRLERRGEAPLEIWDGAHNLDGVGWLLPRVPGPPLRRRRLDPRATRTRTGCWRRSRRSATRSSRPTSSNTRALPAAELARLGSRWFTRTEQERDPAAALAAHARSPGRTERSWSRGRCTCSPTSPGAAKAYHPARDATERLRLRRHRDRGVCRNCVRGGVRRREAPALSHELHPLRRQHDHHDRQRRLQRRRTTSSTPARGS